MTNTTIILYVVKQGVRAGGHVYVTITKEYHNEVCILCAVDSIKVVTKSIELFGVRAVKYR